MRLSVILLFLQLWGNVEMSSSQNACSKLPDVPHAQVSDQQQQYQEGDLIRFTCKPGYTASVPAMKYLCMSEGWRAVRQGTCYFSGPNCTPPPADAGVIVKGLPENDDPILPDILLTFSCDDPGKYLNGSSVLTCGKDGQWDNPFPSCEDITCEAGVMPPHLNVAGLPPANETMKIGHKLQFSCDDQYTMEGSAESECLQTGQWSAAFPTCTAITCTVPNIENGYVPGNIQEYKEHEVLHYECNAGYKRAEERPSKCIKLGIRAEWSPTPACEAIKCKLTLPPVEGTRYEPTHRNLFSPGDTLRVICGEKYWISTPQDASAVTTCKDDGEWTIRPICQEVRCSNQRPRHVYSWQVYWGQRIGLGDTVSYWCRSGYRRTGGATWATCTRDGWNPDPLCQAITCTVPNIENGYVPGNIQEYKEHEVLHYECSAGYKRAEERPSKCTKLGIRAEWSPTPACESIKCKLTLPPVEGTRYEPTHRNLFSPGDTLRVICGEKYWISTPQDASAVTTCSDDGEWTIRPICQEVRCSNQRPRHVYSWQVYWGQRIGLGDTVSYWCRSGYRRTGGATWATCTRDGWNPDPLCQEITCDREDVPNAKIITNDKQIYKNNEQASYECEEGYRGQFTLTCGERGWHGNAQCTAVDI